MGRATYALAKTFSWKQMFLLPWYIITHKSLASIDDLAIAFPRKQKRLLYGIIAAERLSATKIQRYRISSRLCRVQNYDIMLQDDAY